MNIIQAIFKAENSDLLQYTPTPVHEFHHPVLEAAGVRMLIKREDLNHPFISGNKWWKLKYNLEEAKRQNKKLLLTFGGAFSNHIYATAAAAHECNFESIGIIRGEEVLPLNPTLLFAKEQGMKLHFISREDYRKKNDIAFIQSLHEKFGDFYLIPEGGTNEFAIKGCAEFAQMLLPLDFNYIYLPVGTGGTMAGLVTGLQGTRDIVGVSVLKGDFLKNEVEDLLRISDPDKKKSSSIYGNWSILTSYHHGGYAKVTPELMRFIREMKQQNLPLDPVYTGKLMWAVLEEVKKGSFKRGCTILVLHTGGLQGTTTYQDLYEEIST